MVSPSVSIERIRVRVTLEDSRHFRGDGSCRCDREWLQRVQGARENGAGQREQEDRGMSRSKQGSAVWLGLSLMALGAGCATSSGGPEAAVAAAAPQITADVVYGHKDGMALVYDVLKPAKANGAGVAFMVSGGWFSRWSPPEERAAGFKELLARGFTVFAVYHGSAPRFKVPDAVADVRQAIRHIRLNAASYGIDPQRIGVTGGSAGGHLSLMLGMASDPGEPAAKDPLQRTSDQVQAVVALFPPVDLTFMVGPSERFPALDFSKDEAVKVSPIGFVSADDPPTLLIHGDKDQLVPIRNSTVMLEALKKVNVESELIVVEGGEHGFRNPEHRQRSQAAMVAWFEKHLAPPVAARK
jgi:acetyl esterase/lipase